MEHRCGVGGAEPGSAPERDTDTLRLARDVALEFHRVLRGLVSSVLSRQQPSLAAIGQDGGRRRDEVARRRRRRSRWRVGLTQRDTSSERG